MVKNCWLLLQIKPTWCTIFLSMFISFLCMFRATMCPSSGETTVFMRHFVLVILHSGIQDRIQNNKYQVSHKSSCFSWWWAHSRLKHVEKRNMLRKIVHQVSFIYKNIQGCTVKKHEIVSRLIAASVWSWPVSKENLLFRLGRLRKSWQPTH